MDIFLALVPVALLEDEFFFVFVLDGDLLVLDAAETRLRLTFLGGVVSSSSGSEANSSSVEEMSLVEDASENSELLSVALVVALEDVFCFLLQMDCSFFAPATFLF